jgi:hypothetical protein
MGSHAQFVPVHCEASEHTVAQMPSVHRVPGPHCMSVVQTPSRATVPFAMHCSAPPVPTGAHFGAPPSASQPHAGATEQLPPKGLAPQQTPWVHDAPVGHAFPQDPQLLALVCSSTHAPPQTVSPVGQAHVPLVQTLPPVHAAPHDPQLFASVAVFTHAFPHTSGKVDGHAHVLALHTPLVLHAAPQAPQLLASLLSSTHTDPHRA